MKSINLRIHPVAEAFPLVEGDSFQALMDDIRANGLLQPIVLHEGAILDGRNRYRACQDLEVEPKTVQWNGECGDPVSFVVSMNLQRRHLSESQRGMIAGRLARLPHGGDRKSEEIKVGIPTLMPTLADAAKMLSVDRGTAQQGRRVQEKGSPVLVAAVERDEISLYSATEIVTLPHVEQATLVAQGKAAVVRAAREIRESRRATCSAQVAKGPPEPTVLAPARPERKPIIGVDPMSAMPAKQVFKEDATDDESLEAFQRLEIRFAEFKTYLGLLKQEAEKALPLVNQKFVGEIGNLLGMALQDTRSAVGPLLTTTAQATKKWSFK